MEYARDPGGTQAGPHLDHIIDKRQSNLELRQ